MRTSNLWLRFLTLEIEFSWFTEIIVVYSIRLKLIIIVINCKSNFILVLLLLNSRVVMFFFIHILNFDEVSINWKLRLRSYIISLLLTVYSMMSQLWQFTYWWRRSWSRYISIFGSLLWLELLNSHCFCLLSRYFN